MNLFLTIWRFQFLLAIMTSADSVGTIANGQCVMYNHCGENPNLPGLQLNCLDSGPPRKVDNKTAYTELQKYCSELVATFGEELCCSTSQISDLVNNLLLSKSLLEKCPACYYNFRQIFCAVTCSPKQFEFLKPKEIVDNGKGRSFIKSLEVYVDDSYITETFKSCKGVAGGMALDLMCGPWGAGNCTQYRWYEWMGSTENGVSPFDIIYRIVKTNEIIEGITPFNFQAIRCSQPIRNDSGNLCSCIDCKESCPQPRKVKQIRFQHGRPYRTNSPDS